MSTHQLRTTATVLVSAALIVVQALPAAAATVTTSHEPVQDLPAISAPLGAKNGTRGISPAGCGGTTDYAHHSGGDASVHGRTKCTRAVSKVGVTTILQKKGWLIWESMKSDSSSRTGAKNSQDAHPHWRCSGWGTQSYRGYSSHYSIESGRTYTTATASPEKRFGC